MADVQQQAHQQGGAKGVVSHSQVPRPPAVLGRGLRGGTASGPCAPDIGADHQIPEAAPRAGSPPRLWL